MLAKKNMKGLSGVPTKKISIKELTIRKKSSILSKQKQNVQNKEGLQKMLQNKIKYGENGFKKITNTSNQRNFNQTNKNKKINRNKNHKYSNQRNFNQTNKKQKINETKIPEDTSKSTTKKNETHANISNTINIPSNGNI